MTDAVTALMADDPIPNDGDTPPTPAPAPDPVPDPAPKPVADPAPAPKNDPPAPNGDTPPAPKPDDPKPNEPVAPDWRKEAAGDNEDYLKLANRYGSMSGILKALYDTKQMISQGKFLRGKPDDPSDEKAMKEWRKQEGIPDTAEGYKLPEEVTKALGDSDKPILSNWTEFAHSKGARPDVVSIGAEWYVQQMAATIEATATADRGFREDCEDALRLDWQGEYKANINLAKRFLDDSPLGKERWASLRDEDGRVLGSNPAFLKWASDQGRERFGDAVFANPDSEKSHNAEKEEIQNILKTDRQRYYREGWDKKYAALLEREEKRAAKK